MGRDRYTAIQHMEVELGLLGTADCISRYFRPSMDSKNIDCMFVVACFEQDVFADFSRRTDHTLVLLNLCCHQ